MDYDWFQPGALGSAESGCALAVARDWGSLDKTERIVGSDSSREGRGIRERSLLRGRVKGRGLSFRAVAGHAPPSWAPKARGAYMRTMRGLRAKFKGGDLNLRQRLAARALGRRVVGGGVLWLSLPRRGWKVHRVEMINVGGDHKAVLAVVVNKRTLEVVRFLVINCMSVSTGPDHAASIMRRGMSHYPDIIMASECADFRAALVDKKAS